MKTQLKNDLLLFKKDSLVELNEKELANIDSGITPFFIVTAFGVGFAVGIQVGLAFKDTVNNILGS